MSLARFQLSLLAFAASALLLTPPSAISADAQPGASAPVEKIWMAEQPDQPAKAEKHPTCHKVVKVAQALGKELGTELMDTGKDAMMIFSVQDFDPYDESKPPTKKPYRMLDFMYVDGTEASLIKYPDGSGRIQGGFADGTVLIPQGYNKYLVKYPNGARGKLEKVSDSEYQIVRSDNTVTTFSRKDGGSWAMNNSKGGYMGEAVSDETGLRFSLD